MIRNFIQNILYYILFSSVIRVIKNGSVFCSYVYGYKILFWALSLSCSLYLKAADYSDYMFENILLIGSLIINLESRSLKRFKCAKIAVWFVWLHSVQKRGHVQTKCSYTVENELLRTLFISWAQSFRSVARGSSVQPLQIQFNVALF